MKFSKAYFFKQAFHANNPIKAFDIRINNWTNLRSGNKANIFEQTPVKPKNLFFKKKNFERGLKFFCSN